MAFIDAKAGAAAPAAYIDLTHPIIDGGLVWPGDPPTIVSCVTDVDSPWRLGELSLGEHSGTHLGAPSHFGYAPDMDGFGPELMHGRALIIHCERYAAQPIGSDALAGSLATLEGNLRARYQLVVVATGWASRWGTGPYFTGAPDGVMPAGLAPDGLLYLLDRFSPAVVGIDGPSLDFGGSALSRLVCNLEAARRGVFHLENVALLPDGVPHEADYLLMPLRIAGATGSPARFMLAAR